MYFSCNLVDIVVFGVFLFMSCLIIIEIIAYSFFSLHGCICLCLQSKCFLQFLFVQLTSWSYIPCFFFIMDFFLFPIIPTNFACIALDDIGCFHDDVVKICHSKLSWLLKFLLRKLLLFWQSCCYVWLTWQLLYYYFLFLHI